MRIIQIWFETIKFNKEKIILDIVNGEGRHKLLSFVVKRFYKIKDFPRKNIRKL